MMLARLLKPNLSLHNRVKYYRQLAGLSQSQLAAQVGITHQAVSLIESGRNVPGVQVALCMARIFSVRVEDLFFEPGVNQDTWHVPDDVDVRPGDRVLPVVIGERKVAHLVDITEQPQMLPQIPDTLAVLEKFPDKQALLGSSSKEINSRWQVRLSSFGTKIKPDWTVVSGCEIGLTLLTSRYSAGEAGFRTRSLWLNADNSKAIRQLQARDVHIAAIHLPSDAQGPDCHLDVLKVRFAESELGWLVRRGNPLSFRGAEDLAGGRLRLVNRPEGAGARKTLDRLLREAYVGFSAVNQYAFTVNGHLQVAQAIADGLADVGIGTASAAAAARLDFLSVQSEACDLWIPTENLGLDGVQRILEILSSDVFRRDLRSFGPYDVHNTGRILTG